MEARKKRIHYYWTEFFPLFSDLTIILKIFFKFNWRIITLQFCDGFCHTSTWISHGYKCVPLSWNPSHLPPHPIHLGCARAPALRPLFHASNLHWSSILHMVTYMFQWYSLKSSLKSPLASSTESKSLFFTSVSLVLPCI